MYDCLSVCHVLYDCVICVDRNLCLQAAVGAIKNLFSIRPCLRTPSTSADDTIMFSRNNVSQTYIIDVLCTQELYGWLPKELKPDDDGGNKGDNTLDTYVVWQCGCICVT